MTYLSVTWTLSSSIARPSSFHVDQSRLSIVYVSLLPEGAKNMAEVYDTIDISARSALPVHRTDVKDMVEHAEGYPRDERSGDTEGLRYVAVPLPYHSLPYFRS